MTPQMMVLGLACEEAGTVADIQRRLSDLFRAAAFAKNAAHTNLPQLASKGHVRLVDGREGTYEATAAGIERLREWVRSSPPGPAARETIHGKIEFATIDELVELLIVVRAEAKEFQLASDDVQRQMLVEQHKRLAAPPKTRQEKLDTELTAAHLTDVKMMWDDMAARRRTLAQRLEQIHRNHSQGM